MLGKTKLKHNLFLRRNQINYCNNHMRITWALISIHVIYETTYFTWLTTLRRRWHLLSFAANQWKDVNIPHCLLHWLRWMKANTYSRTETWNAIVLYNWKNAPKSAFVVIHLFSLDFLWPTSFWLLTLVICWAEQNIQW